MTADDLEIVAISRAATLRRYAGYALVTVLLAGVASLAYLYFHAPSPASACAHYADLLEDKEFYEYEIAPEPAVADTKRANFEQQCTWYFEGLQQDASYDDTALCVARAQDAQTVDSRPQGPRSLDPRRSSDARRRPDQPGSQVSF